MKNVTKFLLGAAVVVLASCGGEAATAEGTATDSTAVAAPVEEAAAAPADTAAAMPVDSAAAAQ